MIASPGGGDGLIGVCDLLTISWAGSGVEVTGTSAGQLVALGSSAHTVCSPGVAVAVLVMVPPWKVGSTVTVIVKVATPRGSRVTATLVMSPVPLMGAQVEPVLAAQTQVASMSWDGMVSLIVAVAVVVADSLTDLNRVGERFSRLGGGVAGYLGDGDRGRLEHDGDVSAGAVRVLVGVEQLVLGEVTVAVFSMLVPVKVSAMVPATVTVNELGAAWVSNALVAVSVPPEMVAVAPLVAVAVGLARPAGNGSVTVTLAASAGPMLATVIW